MIGINNEYERSIIFRLGRLRPPVGPGLYWYIPFVDRRVTVDIRTHAVELEHQDAVTMDGVTIRVNAVLYYKVVDPVLAITAVSRYHDAVYQSALTAMRNVIGRHDLESVLSDRDGLNRSVKSIVDGVTSPWGIHVDSIEMKDIDMAESVQRALSLEAEAVREKSARIIKAGAELEAARNLAEAATILGDHPMGLELRRLQMLSEIGTSGTVVVVPSGYSGPFIPHDTLGSIK